MSVGHHMIANGGNTEGLFHAAFMESGSPLPYGDTRKGQEWYNSLVNQSGCANTNDSLVCLRETVPAAVIDAIQDHDPTFFNQTVSELSIICTIISCTDATSGITFGLGSKG